MLKLGWENNFHPSKVSSYFESLTGSLTVTLANIKCNVAKTPAIFVPAAAKVNTAIEPVLDEKPSWKNKRSYYWNIQSKNIKNKLNNQKEKGTDDLTELYSHLHSGMSDHRRPCMEGRRSRAGSCTSGSLFLHGGRCPHTPYLNHRDERLI